MVPTIPELSGHFGTMLMVPKCLGTEVSWSHSVLLPCIRHTGCTKKVAPEEFFWFLLTAIENCYIKFYTLVTDSFLCKCRMFYCILCRIDKTVTVNRGNLTFWCYQKLSHTNSTKDKRKHHKCKHFMTYSKCSKCPLAFVHSLKLLLKLWTALFCGKFWYQEHSFSRLRSHSGLSFCGNEWSMDHSFLII